MNAPFTPYEDPQAAAEFVELDGCQVEVATDAEHYRWMRQRMLESARNYRDGYFRERFGFQRRMLRRMLEHALAYRAKEKA